MNAALASVLVLLWVVRIAEIRLCQRNRKKGAVSARGSKPLRVMLAGTLAVNAFIIADLVVSGREPNPGLIAAGAAMLAARAALKFWSVRALSGFWSAEIEIREDHRLVTTGPYAFLRHPAYLANIVEAAAYPVMAGSWPGLVAMIALVVPAHLVRIRVEEQELGRKFGGCFEAYRKATAALIPFVL